MLEHDILSLKKEVDSRLETIRDAGECEAYEFAVLGRKGVFTLLAKKISAVSKEEKPSLGKLINKVKEELEEMFKEKKAVFGGAKKSDDSFDVTLPGRRPPVGHLHPITTAIAEIDTIFQRLGFNRVRYNEVEWDYYAFEALNMHKDHPARDEWETFFITEKEVGPKGRMVLTPHTSSGQVREMEKYSKEGKPIRMMNISKCYRRQIDISHTPMFHQFEGLVVDTQVTVRQLIGTLQYFVSSFFPGTRDVRLRPFHFRFTEPSFEVDISCALCAGKGCSYCKDGWTELGGAGMVHPVVLKAGGYDSKKWRGFAFGFGVERTYLMKNNLNIGDLRLLYNNDIRFLEQF